MGSEARVEELKVEELALLKKLNSSKILSAVDGALSSVDKGLTICKYGRAASVALSETENDDA